MSNYNSLKTIIDANIKQNGNQEITGQILNSVLNQMVNILGAGYQYAGVATPAIDPGTPDAKVFYIANGKGIYTNFGGLEVTEDEVVILYYDTEWHKVSTGIASQAKLSELAGKVDGKQNTLIAGDNIKIEGNVISSINLSVSITWSELKAMRDNSQLIAGTWYRITDYNCTTIQEGTRSAGHPFDIIVIADSENKLNEEAFAIQHEGDTYFSNSNLSAWKLWYSIDNDTTRFVWADKANGKGVIYRMIDEFKNDVPYDFKNIQFYRQKDSSKLMWSIISTDNSGNPFYTFSFTEDSSSECIDCSLSASNNVYSNVIKSYNTGSEWFDRKQTLNNNCFFVKTCYNNSFGNDCYNNTLGIECHNNSFGNNCYNNAFSNYFSYNSFRDYCNNIFFGNYGNNNSFGFHCTSNTFGDECGHNTFGNTYDSNFLGNKCNYNTFGDGCYGNTFGNNCYANIVESNCHDIKFMLSNLNTKCNFYKNNRFGEGCEYIALAGTETASDSQQVQNYNFVKGLKGTSSKFITIDGERNRAFETKVAKNSNGELKVYCEADLIK